MGKKKGTRGRQNRRWTRLERRIKFNKMKFLSPFDARNYNLKFGNGTFLGAVRIEIILPGGEPKYSGATGAPFFLHENDKSLGGV